MLIVALLAADHRWVVWIGTAEQWARCGTLLAVAGRTWSIVDIVNLAISTTLVITALASLAAPAGRLGRVIGRRGANTAHP